MLIIFLVFFRLFELDGLFGLFVLFVLFGVNVLLEFFVSFLLCGVGY